MYGFLFIVKVGNIQLVLLVITLTRSSPTVLKCMHTCPVVSLRQEFVFLWRLSVFFSLSPSLYLADELWNLWTIYLSSDATPSKPGKSTLTTHKPTFSGLLASEIHTNIYTYTHYYKLILMPLRTEEQSFNLFNHVIFNFFSSSSLLPSSLFKCCAWTLACDSTSSLLFHWLFPLFDTHNEYL